MHRWQAAIATENPKLMYLLVELLKRLELSFILCTPGDERLCDAKVILTTPSEAHRTGTTDPLVVEEGFDALLLTIGLLARLHDIEYPRYAYIGVDPGMMSGIALVTDGHTLFQNSFGSPRATAEAVVRLKSAVASVFPGCNSIVRIGEGSRLFSVLLFRAVSDVLSKEEIEVVNEEGTTLPGGPGSNESSAILIAGRRGRAMVDGDLTLEAKPGYIKSLKTLVRRATRSRRSVSTETARAVVVGEKSLDQLLDELAKRGKSS